jgi:hypothetical protein
MAILYDLLVEERSARYSDAGDVPLLFQAFSGISPWSLHIAIPHPESSSEPKTMFSVISLFSFMANAAVITHGVMDVLCFLCSAKGYTAPCDLLTFAQYLPVGRQTRTMAAKSEICPGTCRQSGILNGRPQTDTVADLFTSILGVAIAVSKGTSFSGLARDFTRERHSSALIAPECTIAEQFEPFSLLHWADVIRSRRVRQWKLSPF